MDVKNIVGNLPFYNDELEKQIYAVELYSQTA